MHADAVETKAATSSTPEVQEVREAPRCWLTAHRTTVLLSNIFFLKSIVNRSDDSRLEMRLSVLRCADSQPDLSLCSIVAQASGMVDQGPIGLLENPTLRFV